MAENTKAIARNTADNNAKTRDVSTSNTAPIQVVAEGPAIKPQAPANLRIKRLGQSQDSFEDNTQAEAATDEYLAQASGATDPNAPITDSGAAAEVGALLPAAAAFNPLTAVLIGVGVAAAASGGSGGGATSTTPTLATPTLALTKDSFGAGTTGTATDMLTNSAALTFSAAASDVTREYKIGAGAWTSSYTAPTTDGAYTVQVRDTDKAGNVKTASLSFTLDTTLDMPTLALTSDSFGAGTGGTATDMLTNSAALTFSAAAADVTREYKIGAGAWTSSYTAPTTDGAYTVQVRDTDKAGNVKTASLSFTLDTTLDVPTLALSTDNFGAGTGGTATDLLTNNAALTFSAAASDAGAWIAALR